MASKTQLGDYELALIEGVTALEGSKAGDELKARILEEQIKEDELIKYQDILIAENFDLGLKPLDIKGEADYAFDRVTNQEVLITQPAYKAAEPEAEYGVLNHIDAPNQMWAEAQRGILKLRDELNTEVSDGLIAKAQEFIRSQYESDKVDHAKLDEFFLPYLKMTQAGERELDDEKSLPLLRPFGVKTIPTPGVMVEDQTDPDLKENDKTALFGSGRVLRDDIREVQQLRSALLRYRRWQKRQVKIKTGERERIREQLPKKHRELAILNRERLEKRGDYQVVQQLVRENWKEVAERYAQRAEILENHKGLFYARVRETPFSRPLPRELPLRHVSPDDIVPGCPMEDQEVPAELEPFMETVLELPLGSWRALRQHYRLLPGRRRLLEWNARRQSRMQYKINKSYAAVNSALGVRMTGLRKSNQSLIREQSRISVKDKTSLLELQRNSREVLSLEDLLSGSGHRLRGHAETLASRLNQASVCLLDALRGVRPSLRLQWAEAAEHQRLDVQRPDKWPGIDEARDDDFNGLRTLAELIDWWYRQLHAKAGAQARGAVGNLLRACLLLAANDDPQELLEGKLKVLPGKLLHGDRLRVTLNREPQPGTQLQLLDAQSRIVGKLRVDDVDDDGVITTITEVIDKVSIPDYGFTIAGFGMPGVKRS